MIDVHAVNQKKTKQKKKKVHRFLQKKKMIDVHAVKNFFKKKVYRFLQLGRKKLLMCTL